MDVIKKKHWWQSDQLKWSVIGLLGLLVGLPCSFNVRTRGVSVRHHDADFKLCWPVYFRKS